MLEPDCEDYGQAVVYKGSVPRHPASWSLDGHHEMETGKVTRTRTRTRTRTLTLPLTPTLTLTLTLTLPYT